jgi:hypothetical protein
MNIDEQKMADFEKGNAKSAAEFIDFIEICLYEGWSPTKCPQGCPVEPPGFVRTDTKVSCLNSVLSPMGE